MILKGLNKYSYSSLFLSHVEVLLSGEINIKVSLKGFPTPITSALTMPGPQGSDGYLHFVFSGRKNPLKSSLFLPTLMQMQYKLWDAWVLLKTMLLHDIKCYPNCFFCWLNCIRFQLFFNHFPTHMQTQKPLMQEAEALNSLSSLQRSSSECRFQVTCLHWSNLTHLQPWRPYSAAALLPWQPTPPAQQVGALTLTTQPTPSDSGWAVHRNILKRRKKKGPALRCSASKHTKIYFRNVFASCFCWYVDILVSKPRKSHLYTARNINPVLHDTLHMLHLSFVEW